jgi:hypothetical protein
MPGPSAREIAALLAEVRNANATGTAPAGFAERKADLFERIAAARPDDTDAAQVASDARAAADREAGDR